MIFEKKIIIFLLLGVGLSFCVSSAGDGYIQASGLQEAKETIELLQKQLDEKTRLYCELEAKLREYQLALGGMLDSETLASPERKEEQLLQVLSGISEYGSELVASMNSMAAVLKKSAEKLPPESPERAEMVAQAAELSQKAAKFGAMIKRGNAGEKGTCNVLAFDRASGVVILSAGSINGVFPGTVYKVKEKDLYLRVFSCRGFVSGARVSRGDWDLLAPGEECHLVIEHHGDGRIVP